MDILSVWLHQRSRKIGMIIPDVVLSEDHTDDMELTSHPVERPPSKGGAELNVIVDHCYRKPATLVMVTGFAGGGAVLDFASTVAKEASLGSSPKEMYQKLLEMQRSRKPVDVVTGKRVYKNMLLTKVIVKTDAPQENVLVATLSFTEVMLTQTKVIRCAEKAAMAQGVNTSGVQHGGMMASKNIPAAQLPFNPLSPGVTP